jgi:hypothetical protein
MNLLQGAIESFANRETHSRHEPPPQPPPPWVAEWDQQDERWIFVNRETGERTRQFPQYSGGYQGGGGYGGGAYGGGQYQQEEQRKPGGHGLAYGAAGAAAGLAGGALLMHEGDNISQSTGALLSKHIG